MFKPRRVILDLLLSEFRMSEFMYRRTKAGERDNIEISGRRSAL